MSYLGNQPGVGSFIVSTERFNGNGSCTQFTITQTGIQDANVIDVIVSSVPQDPINSYSIASGVITFTEAPPSGTENIIVRYRATTVITYGNVTGSQISDGTITASKLAPGVGGDPAAGSYANSAFNTANAAFSLANGTAIIANTDFTGVTVSAGTYGSATAIPSITIAANGRVTAVTTAAASSDPIPNILMLSGM
jgi:hypothetical protein